MRRGWEIREMNNPIKEFMVKHVHPCLEASPSWVKTLASVIIIIVLIVLLKNCENDNIIGKILPASRGNW
jgi:hypothetical protein